MKLLLSFPGFIGWRNYDVSICRRLTCCLLVLVFSLATAGCGNRLGSDAGVSEQSEKLATQVKVALVQEPGLNAAPIDIKVRQGVVTLEGFVETESQREAAEKAAAGVKGVATVINAIDVK